MEFSSEHLPHEIDPWSDSFFAADGYFDSDKYELSKNYLVETSIASFLLPNTSEWGILSPFEKKLRHNKTHFHNLTLARNKPPRWDPSELAPKKIWLLLRDKWFCWQKTILVLSMTPFLLQVRLISSHKWMREKNVLGFCPKVLLQRPTRAQLMLH